MTSSTRQGGFTLVELSLAIVMVAMLAMAILTTSIQVTKIYSKGITLKSTNQAARDISDQLTRDLRTTVSSKINLGQVANSRLCIGSAAYLWNSEATLTGVSGAPTPITSGGKNIRLMRVADPGQAFCTSTANTTVSAAVNQPITDFLGSTSTPLAIYSLTTQWITSDIIQLNFTLGTDASTTGGDLTNSQCRAPTDPSANFDFCSVNKFQILVKVSDPTGGN